MRPRPILSKIEKSLDTEKSRDEMSHSGGDDAKTDGIAEREQKDVVEEEVDNMEDKRETREDNGNKHPAFDPTKKLANTGKRRTLPSGLVVVYYTYGIM